MIFSIKANKDRSREKNVLPLKLNERNKNIIGMGNYYENSKFQLSDVDDYCPDYLCEIPKPKRKRIGSFSDPDFIEPDTIESNTLEKEPTSLNVDKDLNSKVNEYSSEWMNGNMLSIEQNVKTEVLLPMLFYISNNKGRQEGIKSQDTPCFDD